jgi:hypothetical protein
MKAWPDKLAEVDSERCSYMKLAVRGTITDLELDEALGELEEPALPRSVNWRPYGTSRRR